MLNPRNLALTSRKVDSQIILTNMAVAATPKNERNITVEGDEWKS